MTYFFRSITALIVSLSPLAPTAHAMLATYPSESGLNNTSHSYQVRFDGEGEANVVASITYQNVAKEPLTSFAFTIPGQSVKVTQAVEQLTVETTTPCPKDTTCTLSYPRTEQKYTRLTPAVTVKADEASVVLALEPPVKSNETVTFHIRYKATGYVTPRSMGLFDFSYRTPSYTHDIDSLSVKIMTDDSLYLKDVGTGRTNYVPSSFDATLTKSVPELSGFSDFYRSYPEDNAVYKYSSDLDAGESYQVKGSYATSWIRLNYVMLSLAILGMILFLGVIVSGERRMARADKNE